MISGNINNSPVRQVKGKVELYEGSTLLNTFTYRDRLKSFTVERVGEDSKFFGFGICQKLNVKLVDKDRELEINTAHSFKAYLTTGEEYYTPFPIFYITEVHRDENTNELSITAYDALYAASGIPFESEGLADQMEEGETLTLATYANLVALSMGLPPKKMTVGGITLPFPPIGTLNFGEDNPFALEYPEGANLEGNESLREVADDIAEATQSVYYISYDNSLVFKRLDRDGDADLTIGKADYIKLDSKTNRRLAAVCHATELGDNVESALTIQGTTQYVRDNAFWELREDIATLVEDALAAIGGITINQFDCSWRGNYLLEPGDKIDLITKDNAVVSAYLLNDSIEYNGSLKQKTSWKYEDSEAETASNPSTLGESLKKTYARVDKVNKEITILASDIGANSESLASLQLTTDDISAKVGSIETTTSETLEEMSENISTLSQSVEAKMTDEQVSIKITEALSNGINKVETSTGFTFDDEGLTIEKTDEDGNRVGETATQITENGMTVFDANNEAVLTANNNGVDAKNLHATTYLIIGDNSRFEDYLNKTRTGCFWIGG